MTLSGNASLDQAIAGFLSGAASTLILHPLDLIKIRLQVNQKYPSIISAMKIIYSDSGIRGLYRGLSPNLLGTTMSWGIYFGIYSSIKEVMKTDKKLSAGQHLLASAEAGLITSLITNPVWVIKTRMCTQKSSNLYNGILDGVYKIWRFEGLHGFYKGIIPSMLGVSHGAIQFMIYEELKKLHTESFSNESKDITTLEYLSMASVSKIMASVITYPYQPLKSNLQIQADNSHFNGLIKTINNIYRKHGILGFYRGLSVNIIRVLPGTCITFGTYEYLSKLFHTLN